MNEVLKNIKSHRSVRVYTDRQVSTEDLNLILQVHTLCSLSEEIRADVLL